VHVEGGAPLNGLHENVGDLQIRCKELIGKLNQLGKGKPSRREVEGLLSDYRVHHNVNIPQPERDAIIRQVLSK
jgi:hypothetical protein